MWPVMVRVGNEDAIFVRGQLLPIVDLTFGESKFLEALDIETIYDYL